MVGLGRVRLGRVLTQCVNSSQVESGWVGWLVGWLVVWFLLVDWFDSDKAGCVLTQSVKPSQVESGLDGWLVGWFGSDQAGSCVLTQLANPSKVESGWSFGWLVSWLASWLVWCAILAHFSQTYIPTWILATTTS